jgi:hypothetical protein
VKEDCKGGNPKVEKAFQTEAIGSGGQRKAHRQAGAPSSLRISAELKYISMSHSTICQRCVAPFQSGLSQTVSAASVIKSPSS